MTLILELVADLGIWDGDAGVANVGDANGLVRGLLDDLDLVGLADNGFLSHVVPPCRVRLSSDILRQSRAGFASIQVYRIVMTMLRMLPLIAVAGLLALLLAGCNKPEEPEPTPAAISFPNAIPLRYYEECRGCGAIFRVESLVTNEGSPAVSAQADD